MIKGKLNELIDRHNQGLIEAIRDTILITGSRDFRDKNSVTKAVFDQLVRKRIDAPIKRIVHGACPTGADRIATEVALRFALELKSYPVDHTLDWPWPAAGPRRNERMLRSEAARVAVVLAFTSRTDGELTPGTLHCATHAWMLGLEVVRP